MDDRKNTILDKIIRKLASEAQETKLDNNSAETDQQQDFSAAELKFDYTANEINPGWNERIDMNISKEKRTYPRKSCFLPVNYATTDRSYQEFIQDISTSGAFIETRHLLPVGQNIAITFTLPSSQENIKINGSISRTTSQGLGVAFMLQDAIQKEYMNSKIARI